MATRMTIYSRGERLRPRQMRRWQFPHVAGGVLSEGKPEGVLFVAILHLPVESVTMLAI